MAIQWHKIFASVQQMHLAAVNIAVTSEFDIISQSPQGDILILTPDEQTGWTEEQRAYLPDGLRDSLAQHHILELKYTEAVNQDVFEQVIGYEYFYRTSRELSRERVRCFILSSHTTAKTTREAYGYHPSHQAGVYHSDNLLLKNIPLILLNELTDAPHNVLFKLFGSQQTVKLSALMGLKRWWADRLSEPLLWLLDGLLKRWFKQGETIMEKVITTETLIEEGKALNAFIIQMTPTEMLRELLHDSPFVQQLQSQAKAEGEAIGKAKGEAIGKAKGEAIGKAKGEAIGKAKGEAIGKAKGEAIGKAEGVAIGGIVEALAIRFEAEREVWQERLQSLSLELLTELRQQLQTIDSLAEFEERFQAITGT